MPTHVQEYISSVNKLIKGPAINLYDPLGQLITVPHFYAAFFGENDKDVYSDIAKVIIRGAPRYAQCIQS